MRVIPAGLQAFLLSGLPFWLADLYTFTLLNGTIYRWTSAGIDITTGGNTFSGTSGPALTRSKWNVRNTAEVPTLVIKMVANNTSLSGLNIKLQMHNGVFDGSRVKLERAYMATDGNTSMGTVLLFEGRSSKLTLTAMGGELTIKADNVLFQQYMPKNLFQQGCIHTTYDPGCTLSQVTNTNSNTVGSGGSGPTSSFIPWGSVPANPQNYAPQGIIAFTSGVLNGQQRSTKIANSTGITTVYPFYGTPSVGDTFNIALGDDKTQATCKARFNTNNIQHWRGFPFTPPAETAI